MITFINCTPHSINLNNGKVYPPSGNVARIGTEYSDFNDDGIATVKFIGLSGLPDPVDGVKPPAPCTGKIAVKRPTTAMAARKPSPYAYHAAC